MTRSGRSAAALPLRRALDRLYAWADDVYGRHEGLFGEWEFDYPAWEEIYEAADGVLEQGDGDRRLLAEDEAAVLLEAIARDNECEELCERLSVRPTLLRVLVRYAVVFPDPEARWQVALAISRAHDIGMSEAENLIMSFKNDKDEYVRRRALLALADRGSALAGPWAEEAWHSDVEYQRIAALHAAKSIGHPLYRKWLVNALRDSRPHLRACAERLAGVHE